MSGHHRTQIDVFQIKDRLRTPSLTCIKQKRFSVLCGVNTHLISCSSSKRSSPAESCGMARVRQ